MLLLRLQDFLARQRSRYWLIYFLGLMPHGYGAIELVNSFTSMKKGALSFAPVASISLCRQQSSLHWLWPACCALGIFPAFLGQVCLGSALACNSCTHHDHRIYARLDYRRGIPGGSRAKSNKL
jgi:hypothetical protein